MLLTSDPAKGRTVQKNAPSSFLGVFLHDVLSIVPLFEDQGKGILQRQRWQFDSAVAPAGLD